MANEAALSALADWRKSRGLNPKTGRETKPSMGKQLMNTIGAPEYDPNKYASPDDYVNAVNAHTANFEIDRTGAINNTKTGETVGYENRTMGPNKTTVTGYSTVKQPPPTALSSAQSGNWWDKINSDAIEAVKAQIAQQTQALQDQLANNKMLTKQQVDAMNTQLAENVKQMQQMNNVNDFRIAENENRFGGTYSGGLRLQQAANDRSTNEAIGAATRDTQARSANLWSQYGQLAQQAYDKIANLSQQTPELVQQYISRALQNAGAYGALTGQLPGGGQTFAAQNQQFNQGMDMARFGLQQQQFDRDILESDRNYNFQVAQQNWDNAFKQGQFDFQKAQQLWENQFQDKSFAQAVKENAQRMGLDAERLTQAQEQFLAEMTYKNKALELDQQKFEASQNETPESKEPSKNELEATYVINLDQMTEANRRKFFENEKAQIIKDLGKSGYDKLKEDYGIYD